MSEKSELEYLLDALKGEVHPRWLNLAIRRAIERRKQDLAKEVMQDAGKSNPTGNAQPGAAHPADNTPKGGGDGEYFAVTSAGSLDRVFKPFTTDRPKVVRASAFDALLAERDALSAHDSQCIKDRVAYCEEIEELEAAVERLTAERDAARAEILELHEKVSFLESREVCAAAHDDVETCGYCQRDAARAELAIVREQYASYRECAGASIGANLDEKLLEQLSESDAQLSQARAELKEAVGLLREMRPYTDAMICYASTITEHPPNGWAKRIDAVLEGENAS